MIPDAVKRSVYVETCSEKFNISADILFDRIRKTRDDMLIADRKQEDARKLHERIAAMQTSGMPQRDSRIPAAAEQPRFSLENPYLAPCERELLGFILEHGCTYMEFDKDSEFRVQDGERPDTVAEFIGNALADDDVHFSNTAFRKVYEKYFELYDRGMTQEQIQTRLMNSQDNDIASVTADILVDKYILTVENYRKSLTAVATQLVIFVPKSLLAYQGRRLDEMTRELSARLDDSPEPQEQLRILEKMNMLNKARTRINNKLGRV